MFNHIKYNITLPLIVICTLFLSACSSESSDDPSALDPGNKKPTNPINASVFSNIEGEGILRFSDQQTCSSSCQKEYRRDSNINITATPISGYQFSGWNGDCSGSNTTCSLKLNGNKQVQATFVKIKYNLSLSNSNGNGSIAISGNGQSCASNCSMSFNQGEQIVLTATANTGYTFTGWSGGNCSGTAPCSVTMNQNINVTANYTQKTGGGGNSDTFYRLNTEVANGQGGYISKINNGDCKSTCSEDKLAGSNISLTATPYEGYTFDHWAGACTGTAAQCSFTLNKNETVTATFKRITHIATTSVIGSGSIKTFAISCKDTCSLTLDHGTQLTLEATPDAGYQFKQWSGACSGNVPICDVSVTKAVDVKAEFITKQHVLVIKNQGEGGVTSSTANCSALLCSSSHNAGTQLTLTAKAKTGYEFAGWTGDCSGTNTCSITMNQNHSVTANFTKVADNILTAKIAGSGSITGLKAACSSGSCSETYPKGSTITLTATPSTGYEFAGWTGDCEGKSACNVNMDKSRSVTANFIKETEYVLIAKIEGQGNISGLKEVCNSASCSSIYTKGAQVTLTASAQNGYKFTGWSGSCSGTASCNITMDQAHTATATFTAIKYDLTTQITGEGSVTVNGTSCAQQSCTTQIDANTKVTLKALPKTGYELTSWSGACSGQSDCLVSMDKNYSVTATFAKKPITYTLTIPAIVGGSLNVDVNGDFKALCGKDTCTLALPENATVKLSAQIDADYKIQQWADSCSKTATTETHCSLVMASDLQAGIKLEQIQKVTHQATVSWDIPDKRQNGDDLPLSEIGGYSILYKRTSETAFKSMTINVASQHEVTIKDLTTGEYQFKIASFDTEGIYGEYSEPAYKTF